MTCPNYAVADWLSLGHVIVWKKSALLWLLRYDFFVYQCYMRYILVFASGVQWSEDILYKPYMTNHDTILNDDKISALFINAFSYISQTGGSLRQILLDNLKKLNTKNLVENGIDVQKIRKEQFIAQPQPDLHRMLEQWFEIYSNDDLWSHHNRK